MISEAAMIDKKITLSMVLWMIFLLAKAEEAVVLTEKPDVTADTETRLAVMSGDKNVTRTVNERVKPESAPANETRSADTLAAQSHDGVLTRVNREYQQGLLGSSRNKNHPDPGTSGFGFRYSRENNQGWLEYRMSERSALRLRGASRGFKVVAAWQF